MPNILLLYYYLVTFKGYIFFKSLKLLILPLIITVVVGIIN